MLDDKNKETERPIRGTDVTAEDFDDASGKAAEQPSQATAGEPPVPLLSLRRSTVIALIVSAAFFMELLDGAIILPAIPEMARDFGTSAVSVSSGISAYLITVAIFIPASAWMSDRFGARNVFCSAILLFTVASVLCGLSQNLTQFTLARILQGIGGAMMSPVGRIELFRRSERIHTLRLLAFMSWPGLTALIIAPPIGGLLTTYASWHWIFFINIPIGIVGIALVWIFFEKSSGTVRRPFDGLGFALNGGALGFLIYGLEGVSRGQSLWFVVGFSVAGILLGAAAVWRAFNCRNPLLSFEPMRFLSFSTATIFGGAIFRLSAAAIGFLIPLMLQVAFGMSAFDAGLMMVAFLGGDLAIKPVANRILRQYGFRNTLIGDGLVVAVTGCALIWLEPSTPGWIMATVLFVVGAARSVHYTALNSIIFADTPPHMIGAASTLNSMTQQMYSGIGVALAAVVLSAVSGGSGQGELTLMDFRIAFIVMLAMAIITVLTYIPLPADVGERISGRLQRKRDREQR